MKIGVYDPYLDDLGGGEKYMMSVASCLAQEHDVTVFWDNKSDIEAFKKRFTVPMEKISIQKNIFSSNIGFFKRSRMVRKYDAIIILSDGSIPFVYPTKLFLHIQQPIPQRQFTFKDKIKIRCISAIFYNSQFTQQFNNSLFSGVKNTIIYPPVKLLNTQEKKENIIIHVGRFRTKNVDAQDYKKQSFMIDAFKKLVDQGLKGWKFQLASSVKKEDEEAFSILRKNAKGYPIEFHINKSNQELFALYNKAKIYWHASGYGEDLKKHPELAEHFGITTVEAMGAGTVPVVINSGGQKEIVTDHKNGMLWNTLPELLEKTNKVANNKILWQELSKDAIIRAQDFSEEKFRNDIKKLIIE